MEIEKKYLVNELPENLDQYPCVKIEQGYLSVNPVIRIRKWEDEFVLTYKKKEKQKSETEICVNQEVELPLTKEAFLHLKQKIDGKMITKERYFIPYEGKTIELDLFRGSHDGMVLAEIEFSSIKEADCFVKPDWFGANVSKDRHYTNAYLALEEK